MIKSLCTKNVVYGDLDYALSDLENLKKGKNKFNLQGVHYCKHCKGYHLTKQQQTKDYYDKCRRIAQKIKSRRNG